MRRFLRHNSLSIVFGLMFWPQDFYLLVLCMLTGFVSVALVTSAVGRIWCGWLCPQTVFLEMVFRRLEYLIDGSAERQLAVCLGLLHARAPAPG